jgi:beta-lysine 5,6-aminomutase alpha subunit
MSKLNLCKWEVKEAKQRAANIAGGVQGFIDQHSSVSVERTILRLYGVDGVDEEGVPLVNKIIDILKDKGKLENGISIYFSRAMLVSGKDATETARMIVSGEINLCNLNTSHSAHSLENMNRTLVVGAINKLDITRKRKKAKQEKFGVPRQPWRYIIVATGNIYEDRTQAESAVQAGADCIAVIRSTAQSLLDYVPYGATTEGYGGTYATQENFGIMRRALDSVSKKEKRYVRLVNYSSGLCMAEIAACAALEDLDILLNDSMYGILFRDINMKRTFIDQYFSRLICARAGIIINTGEDNYLTTSDAMEKAYTVTASDLINEAMAKKANLTEDLLGLGHAFEIDPKIENAFLFELAHAQLCRELFPNSPIKYMPPTKHKSTDIFYSHCLDTMFNLASILTQQGIHLTGILTEAIHTPLMMDRYQSLKSMDYVFNIARNLGDEIEFKPDGFIERRAKQVLDQVRSFLGYIEFKGLMSVIAEGKFADIKRPINGGKGLDGVFKKSLIYSNPIMDELVLEGVVR